MNIHIEGNLYLRSDKKCFYLAEVSKAGEKAKEPGKEIEKALGYYSTLESAMSGYKKHKLLKSTVTTFDGLKKQLNKIDKKISEIGKVVGV